MVKLTVIPRPNWILGDRVMVEKVSGGNRDDDVGGGRERNL